MARQKLKITEQDEAGNVTATYIQSESDQPGLSRIDLIPTKETKSIWQQGLDVFLPSGYPHSVTKDYLEYQIYDSLQAFSSSIASLLASRAALSSVGVGDSTASPTAALLLSILQESAGRIATILFAYRFGSALEPECKMYRLLADILNDFGFVLDCLSPIFPKPIRVVILSFSSVLRALCGVAAGSAKASLSVHFAKWGNLGELNAKDSSQETVISLIGMLAGSVVVSWITTPFSTWATLILLLSVHLETNRRAVRAVSMRTLNRQRATLVYHHLRRGRVPTPEEVSAQELIFETDGILRAEDASVSGYCTIGSMFSNLLKVVATERMPKRSFRAQQDVLHNIMSMYSKRGYILWADPGGRPPQLQITLKENAATSELLTAWWQALAFACEEADVRGSKPGSGEAMLSQMHRSMDTAAALLNDHGDSLRAAGWDLVTNAMETRASTRVVMKT